MTERFDVVATGGTFDVIHVGHLALLSKAFEVGHRVIIGVSSDEFAKRHGKKLKHNFSERVQNLESVIRDKFGPVLYEIAELQADFGPAVTSGDVGALVASAETQTKGKVLNELRFNRGLKPVKVISVELLRAEDGSPISSTRIRAGEIDSFGRLLKRKRGGKDRIGKQP